MKKSLILLGMLSIGYAYAQSTDPYEGKVGINTSEPKATLDVKSNATDKTKGILTPQVSGDDLKTMTGNLTADQHGMISFATSGVTTADSATANVQFPGFHRFNIAGTEKSWVRLEPSGLEKIKGAGTNTGWALIGREANRYGTIGLNAVDLSIVNSAGFTLLEVNGNTIPRGATGNLSFAVGLNTMASGWNGVAMGNASLAGGASAIALGSTTKALGNYSIALGNDSQAKGWSSTSIGYKTIADGSGSVALGHLSETQRNYAFATGLRANAKGLASIAIGFNVIAGQEQEMALGMYNTEQTDVSTLGSWEAARVLVIGNGRGNYDGVASNRSDAFTVLRNGKVGIDIDNFETTTSDAKLQVNGKILANSLAGTGNRPVYADENGVLVIGTGTAASTGATTLTGDTGLVCNADNRGKMNFIPSTDNTKSDVFGICMRNKDGNYYWGYMVGGNNPTNGTGAFGSGL